jgi:hypothetical protein
MRSSKLFLTCRSIFFGLTIVFLLMPCFGFSQNAAVNPALLTGTWNAHWISCPGISQRAYGVYHFRKHFTLNTSPEHFIIHVSADNRYVLYVNGVRIGRGPARSSLLHWNFGSYDIAQWLRPGDNVIAALVWNMAEYAPVAQITDQTAFLVQGDSRREQLVNTDNTWKVVQDSAYSPCATNMGAVLHSYVVVGPGDEIQGAHYPWGWQDPGYADGSWRAATALGTPVAPHGYGTDNLWTLVPRAIPAMEERSQRLAEIRRDSGVKVPAAFLEGHHPVKIPPHTKVRLLLDQSFETVGYPQLKVSGGRGSRIKLTYAEALFDHDGRKGNRNEISGKTIRGLYDLFYPGGGEDRLFSTLWVRTWRYIEVEAETADEPLVLEDLYADYTGYPFTRQAQFSSSDPSLEQIWKVGWRTARLCAGETYFDCPYYEQLQYEGDTRIQSLISLYNTGDDRLMRKAITDFFHSRVPSGLTQGRYPSSRFQVIPPFSLYWVSMLYDYWMHCPDKAFVGQYLNAASLVLDWYQQHIDTAYEMLGPMEWWSFVDWDDAFPGGVPDGATDGHSSVITLQYAYTLRQAAALFAAYGRGQSASQYAELANQLAAATYTRCFDKERGEMANQPARQKFSQHANIMGVLSGAIPASQQAEVMRHVLSDITLSQGTFYYRFYLTRALIQAGMGDQYYASLTPWREMLDRGLTTFAEKPDPTRSDCHAWSASPIYDFLATICGIMPDAPGFSRVRIQPAMGDLTEVSGSMPLPGYPRCNRPEERVTVHLIRRGSEGILGEITLPPGLSGVFIWHGKEIALHAGTQNIQD